MPDSVGHVNRRDVLRGLGGGVMAAALGSVGLWPGRAAAQTQQAVVAGARQLFMPYTKASKVSLVKGNDRREIIGQALKNIEGDILASLGSKKRILVKPNFVSTTVPLAASHADEIRAILDFFKPRFKGEIIVATDLMVV